MWLQLQKHIPLVQSPSVSAGSGRCLLYATSIYGSEPHSTMARCFAVEHHMGEGSLAIRNLALSRANTPYTHTPQVSCLQQGLQSSDRHFSPWTMNDDKRGREWQREIMGGWWCWVTSQITQLNRLFAKHVPSTRQGLVSEKALNKTQGKWEDHKPLKGRVLLSC